MEFLEFTICLKKKNPLCKLEVVAQTLNLSTQEAKEGELGVQG